MKKSFIAPTRATVAFVFSLCMSSVSFAETITNSFNFIPNVAIPDDDFVGVADTQSISSPIISLSEVRVTLNISGGYNGDLYAYLRHDSGFSILLNRPGKSASDTFGSPDTGFAVVFDSAAANGDIHNYRMTLDPSGGTLTGTWQPDGRNVHPDNVVPSDARTAKLESFVGVNPNGNWTLFIADVSPVGESHLNSWGMQQVGPVPEPSTFALFSLALGFYALKRRRSRKS